MPNETVAVTLPSMGESVTEGVVGSWRKRVGDRVTAGEALVEVQTDKIDAEVPAPQSGRLLRILAEEGQTVAVGAGLAEIEIGPSEDGRQLVVPPPPSSEAQSRAEPSPAPALAVPEQAEDPKGAPSSGPGEEVETPQPTLGEEVEVPLPALGESVTEGVIGAWQRKVGDQIRIGETLVEIQTDKVDAEVPSPVTGVVSEVLVPEGETVAAGTILARITRSSADAPAAARPSVAPLAPASAPAPSDRSRDATPLARRRASLSGVSLTTLEGTGPGGLIRGSESAGNRAPRQSGHQ